MRTRSPVNKCPLRSFDVYIAKGSSSTIDMNGIKK